MHGLDDCLTIKDGFININYDGWVSESKVLKKIKIIY